MFAAIYTWELLDGVDAEEWENNWRDGTAYICKTFGSFGSSLHKTKDGYYIAYARWPNKQAWDEMMQDMSPEKQEYSNDPFVRSVQEPVLLELIDDQLKIE